MLLLSHAFAKTTTAISAAVAAVVVVTVGASITAADNAGVPVALVLTGVILLFIAGRGNWRIFL